MQLVLSNNRVIAHGENFLTMGNIVINTETGARYENATVAECDCVPSDIGRVGYEYHAGNFVPCAPFGIGNNNGYFMEVCAECATPRSSGIPIKGGIGFENLNPELKEILNSSLVTVLWENAAGLVSTFNEQTVTLLSDDWDLLLIQPEKGAATIITESGSMIQNLYNDSIFEVAEREVSASGNKVTFSDCRVYLLYSTDSIDRDTKNTRCTPYRIYGVKL